MHVRFFAQWNYLLALSLVTVCSLFSKDHLQLAFDLVSQIKQPKRLKRYET